MGKRNQINLSLDDKELNNLNEYCRVHGMTPQGLLKEGYQRLIREDILERKADLTTMKSWKEIQAGQDKPIDDLLKMMDEDSRNADNMGY